LPCGLVCGSRRRPHFDREALEHALRGVGSSYVHAEPLGGRRSVAPDSPNAGLRNEAFRGYADHTRTEGFARALDDLIAMERNHPVVMCAEAVPWRCHRWILSDVLVARRRSVEHIIGAGERRPHTLSKDAVLEGADVTYPGDPSLPL
jgi:uncharacterized protein (DUF488 family)